MISKIYQIFSLKKSQVSAKTQENYDSKQQNQEDGQINKQKNLFKSITNIKQQKSQQPQQNIENTQQISDIKTQNEDISAKKQYNTAINNTFNTPKKHSANEKILLNSSFCSYQENINNNNSFHKQEGLIERQVIQQFTYNSSSAKKRQTQQKVQHKQYLEQDNNQVKYKEQIEIDNSSEIQSCQANTDKLKQSSFDEFYSSEHASFSKFPRSHLFMAGNSQVSNNHFQEMNQELCKEIDAKNDQLEEIHCECERLKRVNVFMEKNDKIMNEELNNAKREVVLIQKEHNEKQVEWQQMQEEFSEQIKQKNEDIAQLELEKTQLHLYHEESKLKLEQENQQLLNKLLKKNNSETKQDRIVWEKNLKKLKKNELLELIHCMSKDLKNQEPYQISLVQVEEFQKLKKKLMYAQRRMKELQNLNRQLQEDMKNVKKRLELNNNKNIQQYQASKDNFYTVKGERRSKRQINLPKWRY